MRVANIDPDACDEYDPFVTLMSPDKDSSDRMRNPENEGRRIEEVPGGFRILNYLYYRGLRNEDDRREQNKLAQRRHRDGIRLVNGSSKCQPSSAKVSHDNPPSSYAEAEAEAEAEALLPTESTKTPKVKGSSLARAKDEQEIVNFVKSINLPASDGEWFWNKCEGNGWKNDGKPIVNWKATIRSWVRIGCMASQKNVHQSFGKKELSLGWAKKTTEYDPELWASREAYEKAVQNGRV
jgi:hypothetical protein